jgi:hypothetical protein
MRGCVDAIWCSTGRLAVEMGTWVAHIILYSDPEVPAVGGVPARYLSSEGTVGTNVDVDMGVDGDGEQ